MVEGRICIRTKHEGFIKEKLRIKINGELAFIRVQEIHGECSKVFRYDESTEEDNKIEDSD